MSRIIVSIVANGEPIAKDIIHRHIQGSDLIIAADGGLQSCHQAQISPDYIVGDLDSCNQELIRKFPEAKIKKISDQDSTDLEKTINFALQFNPWKLRFFAVFGLRTDHSLANMIIIQNFSADIAVEVFDNYGKMTLLNEGEHKIAGKINRTVSLITLRPIQNLTISGFKYPLDNHSQINPFFGISNVYSSRDCTIGFSKGRLMLYEPFDE